MIKELVSGIAAAFIFLLLFVNGAFWWLSLLLAVGSYVGSRLLFPPEQRKVLAKLPDGVSQEAFDEYLCGLGDELLVNFAKDPQDIKMAQALPDRLQRLHEILSGYIDLANQKTQSPQSTRALEATEKAITKAVAKFEEMHHRLLENDAIDLSTSAKTFDNLLDFD